MVLKVIGNTGASTYISADEFTTKKMMVKGIYSGFSSDREKRDPAYFNDRYNFLVGKVQKETGMNSNAIKFLTNCEYEELDVICCIQPRTMGKEHDIIVTNQMAYLMSDEGKTIDRLI